MQEMNLENNRPYCANQALINYEWKRSQSHILETIKCDIDQITSNTGGDGSQ